MNAYKMLPCTDIFKIIYNIFKKYPQIINNHGCSYHINMSLYLSITTTTYETTPGTAIQVL